MRQVASRHDMTGDMHSMGSTVFIVREEKGETGTSVTIILIMEERETRTWNCSRLGLVTGE